MFFATVFVTILGIASLADAQAAPPATSISVSGTTQNGWYRSTPTVTLACTPSPGDVCTGTFYNVNGGATQAYGAPFNLGDGVFDVQYWSTGTSGPGAPQTTTLKVDRSGPSIGTPLQTCTSPGTNGWCVGTVTTRVYSNDTATMLYSNDFTSGAGSGWDAGATVGTTPSGDKILGNYPASTRSLSLTGLPAHKVLTIEYDFIAVGTWDGNTPPNGPDTFSIGVDGVTAFTSSVAHSAAQVQCYPLAYPCGSTVAGLTGIQALNILGMTGGDATYHVAVSVPHTGSTATIAFTGAENQAISDESWAMDNVRVSSDASGLATPSPTCTLDSAASTCSRVVSTDGTHTLAVTSTDVAGNTQTTSATVKVDRSVPVVTATQTPAPTAACAPTGGALLADNFDTENGGITQLNYVGFANWAVTRGGTDLFSSGTSHGLQLDLDGSSNRGGVRLESKDVTLQPGCYLLQFRLGQNGVGPNTMTVSLGSLYSEQYTHPADTSYSTIERRIDVLTPTTAKLVFDHDGADNFGLIIDEVLLAPMPGWSTSPVTVTFACTDAVSGVGTFSSPVVTLSTDGADQSTTKTCTDRAGFIGGYTAASINIDQAPPVLTATRTAANANGWNNGDVTVDFTCTDATSGVASAPADVTVTTEGADQSVTRTCTDVAGNVATVTVSNINIDKTAPTVANVQSPSANANGWNNADVTVTFTCTDATSGVDSAPSDIILTEGAAQSASGTCTDLAGNSATSTRSGINVDLTPPTVVHGSACAAGFSFGWCSSGLTTSESFADALSGVDASSKVCKLDGVVVSCAGSQSVTGDGVHQQYGLVYDLAGNGFQSAGSVKLDGTAPVLTVTRTAANANGWNNGPVTIGYTCTDATSGPRLVPANVTLSTEGSSQSVTRSCTDFAGNAASSTVSNINIDLTPPTISLASRVPAANAAGWNSASVTFTWSCADAISGAASSSATQTLTTEGSSLQATGTCTDLAGNTASATQTASIDKTAPVIASHADVVAEATSAAGAAVAYDPASASDALSGVASLGCAPASGSTFPLGKTTVTCSASDVAGNAATSAFNVTVKDTAAPILTATRTPANANGWNNGNVLVHFACTDASSGVASVTPDATVSTEGANQSRTGTCTDNSGNSASVTVSGINLDKSAPTLTGVRTPAAVIHQWSGEGNAQDSVGTANGTVSDATFGPGVSGQAFVFDGVDDTVSLGNSAGNFGAGDFTVSYWIKTSSTRQEGIMGKRPVCGSGSFFDIRLLSDGHVMAELSDTTGNSPNVHSARAVNDGQFHHMELVRAGTGLSWFVDGALSGSSSVGAANLINSAPLVLGRSTCTGVDGTSSFTGVLDEVQLRAGWSNTDVTVSWICTDPLSGVPSAPADQVVTTEGVGQSRSASCSDAAGNSASTTISGINIDKTAPTLTLSRSPTANANGWNAGAVTVSFSCSDALSGVESAPGPVTRSAEGAGQSASGTCTDNAGNRATATATINIDMTPPTIASTRSPAANANGWNHANVIVSFSCTDATSGLASAPADITRTEGAGQSASGTCTDLAGNTATAMVSNINVDLTPPTVTSSRSPAANANGWNNGAVSVSFSCADALSGVATSPSSVSLASEGAGQSATGTCVDRADNGASSTQSGIQIDMTPPTLAPHDDVSAEATGADGAHVAYDAPAVADALSGISVSGCAPASGSLFPLGGTTVTCSATDAAGNHATSSFRVIVADTRTPTIDAHTDVAQEASDANGAIVTYDAPATHDAVDGDGVATCAPAAGSRFALGTTSVTCTATDAAGNAATSSFSVHVGDATPPTIDAHSDITVEATGPAGAVVSYDAPATHDAVDGDGVAACTPASGSGFALGAATVTCTARDAAGNDAASTTFTVAVRDTTPPTIDASSDITEEATGPAGAVVSYEAPASHDVVDGDGVATCSPASGALFPLGTSTVTCGATDAAGNAATTRFLVRVGDATPPTIDAHSDVTEEATGSAGAFVSYAAPATHDTVDGDGVATCSPASGSQFALGETIVSCDATDSNGNAASRVAFTVRVGDTTPPEIAARSDITEEATAPTGAVVSYDAPATDDVVDGAGVATCSPASGALFPLGLTTVTCMASDTAGNHATSTTFDVRVVDTTPPAIAPHEDIVAEQESSAGSHVSYDAPATHDTVDGAGVATCAPTSGSLFAAGTTTVTCDATDAAGNAATSSFSVRVGDATPPTVDPHADITEEATAPAGAVVSYDAPASHDAVDGDGIASCAPASGSLFALGSTTVACDASDASGNAATRVTFTVRVVDTTPPKIRAKPDVVAEAADADGAQVSYDAPATDDAVDGEGLATCAPASGALFPLGSTSVTCTATDAAGNAATPTSFTIEVRDTTAPRIDAHDDAVQEATGADGAVVRYESPATHDAVDGDGIATCAPASGSVFALGDTLVTCTATDSAGDPASTSFLVHVVDTTPPTTDAHADITEEATGAAGAVVSYDAPATHDAVDGDGVATCAPASGSVFALGVTSVTCTAADAAGNAAAPVGFAVTVRDTTAPTIDPHADITAEATALAGAVVSYAAPVTHDAVDGDGLASCAPASGSFFALGATRVTCDDIDHAGQAADPTSFQVVVSPGPLDHITVSGRTRLSVGATQTYKLAGSDPFGNAVALARSELVYHAPTTRQNATVVYCEGTICGRLDVAIISPARIDVTAPRATTNLGEPLPFAVSSLGDDGAPLEGVPCSFAPSMGTIRNGSLWVLDHPGTAHLVATCGGMRGTLNVTVVLDLRVAIQVRNNVTMGDTARVNMTVAFMDGAVVPNANVTLRFAPAAAAPLQKLVPIAKGTTGADGVFAFDLGAPFTLAPGSYTLDVQADWGGNSGGVVDTITVTPPA